MIDLSGKHGQVEQGFPCLVAGQAIDDQAAVTIMAGAAACRADAAHGGDRQVSRERCNQKDDQHQEQSGKNGRHRGARTGRVVDAGTGK